MNRRGFGICGSIVVAAMVAAVFFVAAPASAQRTGKACPTLSASGLKYLVITYKSTTCAAAKHWVLKLAADKDPKAYGAFSLHNGPKGDKCEAVRAFNGRAVQGECWAGSMAFPHSGFQWAGSK